MTSSEDRPGCDRDRLWALAVGVLSEVEARSQEEHLAACPHCRDRLGAIRADVDALGCHAAGGSPEQLAETVLQRSRSLQARARRLRWLTLTALLVAALAGGVYAAHKLAVGALARRELWALEHAIQRIQNAEGGYPENEQELVRALARLQDPQVRLDDRGLPLDHWGRPYRYRYPGTRVAGMFDLWSLGADGVDDEGDPDDQTNWR